MDAEFARALSLGTQAVHAADPAALAAIEGGQIPGWGGYDYARLAGAVDLIELYDGGGNVEILRSLQPGMVLLTTSHERGAAEAHFLWRTLLRGGRGVIFWDPRKRSRRSAAARRRRCCARSRAGSDRSSSGAKGAPRRSRCCIRLRACARSGCSTGSQGHGVERPGRRARSTRKRTRCAPRWRASSRRWGARGWKRACFTPELVEGGALERGIRALILPRVLALSEREAARIRGFVATGGTLIAEGTPGRFDEHVRRLPKPLLSDLFATPGKGKAILVQDANRTKLAALLAEAGVRADLHPGAERRRPGNGRRDPPVAQRRVHDPRAAARAVQHRSRAACAWCWREAARVSDLRERKTLGTVKEIELTLDPVAPTLLRLEAAKR